MQTQVIDRDWRLKRERAYQQWLRKEGVPVYTGSAIDDVHTVEVVRGHASANLARLFAWAIRKLVICG